jgi:hypothetical protein
MAQSNGGAVRNVHSNGLSASLLDLIVTNSEITPEILVKNDTRTRVYLTDPVYDKGQLGFLGSGQQTSVPIVSGIPSCLGDFETCAVTYPNNMELSKLSYIEPGDTLAISLKYSNLKPFNSSDTFSFSLTLIARFAKLGVGSEANEPMQVRFSFPFVAVTRK